MTYYVKPMLVPGGKDELSVCQYHSEVPGIGTIWEVRSAAEIYGGWPVASFRTSLLEKKFGFDEYFVSEQFVIECAMLVALEADKNAREGAKDIGISIWS